MTERETTRPRFFLFHTSPTLLETGKLTPEAWTESDMYGQRYVIDSPKTGPWTDEKLAQVFIGGNNAFHIHLDGPGPGLYAMIARTATEDGYRYALRRTNGVPIYLNDSQLQHEEMRPLELGDVIRIGDDKLHVMIEDRFIA